jgi:nucleoside 2-deoxyribosyltransferase
MKIESSVPLKAYLGIKYHKDHRNRHVMDLLSSTLLDLGIQTVCIARDIEKWGEVELHPQELMRASFEQIGLSDFVILEMTEKGVGLGIEAGYAAAIGKPLIVLTKNKKTLSNTLLGIADAVVQYSQLNAIDDFEHFKAVIDRLVPLNK